MGRTPRGHWLWTKNEDALVRELYPDYDALQKALRRRTYNALRARARTLDVVKRRHTWLGAEISRLRRMYPKAARQELMVFFPDVSWEAIKAMAHRVGVRRERRKLVSTGHPLIDRIRDRAFDLNISMVDLDAMAGTKKYFRKLVG